MDMPSTALGYNVFFFLNNFTGMHGLIKKAKNYNIMSYTSATAQGLWQQHTLVSLMANDVGPGGVPIALKHRYHFL